MFSFRKEMIFLQRSQETEIRLKKFKLNSRLFLILCFANLLVLIPLFSKSQNDTISTSFKIEFSENLIELGDLYCWSDTTFFPGKYQFQSIENVEERLQELNLPFFSEFSNQTEIYFRFFEDLPIIQKQEFVRFFAFYEKEFEAVLLKEKLPVELKYLAPVLSAMNPKASSLNQQAGVWQLKHFQAVFNGLQINKFIDERFDVILSTKAAAKQIKQNLNQFKSIDLAIAAYIYGNVKIRNAIDLSSENGIKVFECLPKSFLENIAVFQAVSLFLSKNKYSETIDVFVKKIKPDTAKINRQLHFQQVADVLGISLNHMQYLNPQYKFSIVPGNEKQYKIILPAGEWDDFVLWQDSIYNSADSSLFRVVTQSIEYPPSPNRQYAREPVKDLEIEGKTKIKYRLKTGDVLGIIAENYDVRVADLKYWNNIYNERKIQAGKNLDIFVDENKAEYYLSLATSKKEEIKPNLTGSELQKSSTLKVFEDLNSAEKIEHIVKSGESPYVIAKQYKGVTPDQILEWNNINDARKIQIGQKLIVYLHR